MKNLIKISLMFLCCTAWVGANNLDANNPDGNKPGANKPGANNPGVNNPGTNSPDPDSDAEASADQAQLEKELNEAGLLLESQRKPKEAAILYRKVWNAPGASRKMKGEALAGLIQCEQLLGNSESAKVLMSELMENYWDISSVSRKATEIPATGNMSAFLRNIDKMAEGTFLDLDTGAIYTSIPQGSGTVAEITVRNKTVQFLAEFEDSFKMNGRAPWLSSARWVKVVTDMGRTSWVQVLRKEDPAVIRYMTRVSGSGTPMPAPKNLFALGDGNQIELHFDKSVGYATYRIERRDDEDQPFQVLSQIKDNMYIDKEFQPDSVTWRSLVTGAHDSNHRYEYRVTGIMKTGTESIPATVCATRSTRGAFSGSVALNQKDSFDFLTGTLFERTEGKGDITLTGIYGSCASSTFTQYLGMQVSTLDGPESLHPSPWTKGKDTYIPRIVPFLVPLRGGGVARCRWTPADRRSGSAILLYYEVNPDAAYLVRPQLTVERKGRKAEIQINAPEGYEVETITAFNCTLEKRAELPVSKGIAYDTSENMTEGITVYRARAVDKFGRQTSEGETFLNLLPREIRKGEFQLLYGQGYSIDLQKRVPTSEADVIYFDCSGGLSTVTLYAPVGITNLKMNSAYGGELEGCTAAVILEAIVSSNRGLRDFTLNQDGESRSIDSNVFILRTRYGGWAKLAIIDRSEDKDVFWQEKPVTIQYVYNPEKPEFNKTKDSDIMLEGIWFDKEVLEENRKQ